MRVPVSCKVAGNSVKFGERGHVPRWVSNDTPFILGGNPQEAVMLLQIHNSSARNESIRVASLFSLERGWWACVRLAIN